MNIGEALRENRERRGYTVHRLAELLDVDAQMILDWEQDKSQPDVTRCLLLSN